MKIKNNLFILFLKNGIKERKEQCLSYPNEYLFLTTTKGKKEFSDILNHINGLKYEDRPDYDYIQDKIEKIKNKQIKKLIYSDGLIQESVISEILKSNKENLEENVEEQNLDLQDNNKRNNFDFPLENENYKYKMKPKDNYFNEDFTNQIKDFNLNSENMNILKEVYQKNFQKFSLENKNNEGDVCLDYETKIQNNNKIFQNNFLEQFKFNNLDNICLQKNENRHLNNQNNYDLNNFNIPKNIDIQCNFLNKLRENMQDNNELLKNKRQRSEEINMNNKNNMIYNNLNISNNNENKIFIINQFLNNETKSMKNNNQNNFENINNHQFEYQQSNEINNSNYIDNQNKKKLDELVNTLLNEYLKHHYIQNLLLNIIKTKYQNSNIQENLINSNLNNIPLPIQEYITETQNHLHIENSNNLNLNNFISQNNLIDYILKESMNLNQLNCNNINNDDRIFKLNPLINNNNNINFSNNSKNNRIQSSNINDYLNYGRRIEQNITGSSNNLLQYFNNQNEFILNNIKGRTGELNRINAFNSEKSPSKNKDLKEDEKISHFN